MLRCSTSVFGVLRFASRRVDRSRNEELFGLRVRGERMHDAGILPGDIVIVRRLPSVEDGAIVVALVDEEATIKRLLRRAMRRKTHVRSVYFVVAPNRARTGHSPDSGDVDSAPRGIDRR
ncbi:hypothetical protein THIOKS1490003 [Thiocapsa sp. KS1]|nr:hypothetical protein THIOKS1490003 [Thiocapsa sp. KS1]